MIEAKDILPLIGIPGAKIKYVDTNGDSENTIIFLELEDKRGYCPYCHSSDIGIKDYYNARINNTIVKHKKITCEIRVRRYVCKRCHKTFKQEYDLANKGSSISNEVKKAIVEDLKEPLTFTQIAKDHQVSLTTVVRILQTSILKQLPLKLSEVISIDEFCFKHTNNKLGKYPAVITNPLTGKIIDIIVSRWKDVLFDYFNKVKYHERFGVKYFISDMNETYRQLKRAFFHNATHIVDRFHLIKAFNDAITSIRTRIIKQNEELTDKEYRYLKKNWKVFLKDRNDLKMIKTVNKLGIVTDPTEDLDRCLKRFPDLFNAYWTKEEFRFKTRNLMLYKDAENLIYFYEKQLLNSTILELNKVGRTLKNWRGEIINGMIRNGYNHRLTNAVAESTNNQIQTLINICHGIPNFENMRQRVLYINRSKK